MMDIIGGIEESRQLRDAWGTDTMILVPTMGALHAGHDALIQKARTLADKVLVSIFVNPLQFGPTEDFSRYPRPLEDDLKRCKALGVDAVFNPETAVLYPYGINGPEKLTTIVPPTTLTERLCGLYRPGHFTGVATVVYKLFQLLKPNRAIFGEKDAQQLAVIRRMVSDLDLPVDIIAHPTIRDKNGLALSSRNRYLKTSQEQTAALCLFQILEEAKRTIKQACQPLPAKKTLAELAQALTKDVPSFRLQYLEVVNKHTFEPVDTLDRDSKVLIAAYVNEIRLIDNMEMT